MLAESFLLHLGRAIALGILLKAAGVFLSLSVVAALLLFEVANLGLRLCRSAENKQQQHKIQP